jgi:hypothetical protein
MCTSQVRIYVRIFQGCGPKGRVHEVEVGGPTHL